MNLTDIQPEQYLPIAIIIMYFCAGLVSIFYGDYKRSIYWVSAGILTLCVTI